MKAEGKATNWIQETDAGLGEHAAVRWQKVTTAREKKQTRVYRGHTCQTPQTSLERMTPLRYQVAEIKQAAVGLRFQSNLILKPSPGHSL